MTGVGGMQMCTVNEEQLERKWLALAGIAASVAGGYQPALQRYYAEAEDEGATLEEIDKMMQLGRMIKIAPIQETDRLCMQLTGKKPQGCGCNHEHK